MGNKVKKYWDHYFNPLKVDGPIEILFRSALLTFLIIGMIIIISTCFGITIFGITIKELIVY